MKKVLLAAFTSLIFLVMSCTGSDDPKEVLSQFLEALSENDMLKARSLATADSKFSLDMLDLAMKTNTREIEIFDITGKELGDAKMEGETVMVPVKEKSTGTTMKYILKKENGSWKVSFNNDAIMNIGIDLLKGLRNDGKNYMDNGTK